ncbi:hypothetical protein QYE76_032543 [Lolium multiflorum]|uniref:Transposase (putative) gypsy type domain-containing protein n=1 Tax=Lolium multiflorum TaxID=4521 RepID=A0AAD8VL95_LOLMU|nr:hypothetical protein QYE76_032543 [Lolium multiflorum]
MKKEDAIRFPSYPNPPMEYRVSFVDHLIRGLSAPIHDFLRGLLFVYGIQLHQLTPNSILHISIFITLCECFLGVPPNWALWKRIFCLRRNASRATYNIGGVVICVRTDVDYFDVKFPDSVQGWRKRWLYIYEESANYVEHNIIPFDGNAKIQRRRSWDAEASEEEKKATEALMSRIHQLQNTRGKELSGVQITAYFLRIRVQPLQARKNPLWTYAGENDANRLSNDLSAKDLEKLIQRISRLNKKDPVPSSCRVEPYSSTNPLPEMTEGAKRGSREEPLWAQTQGGAAHGLPRHPVLWGPTTPFASFSSRTPSSRKPKPQRGPHEGLQPPLRAENTREKELSGGQESAGEIPSRRGKSTPSPSSSSGTSSPSSSSSSPPSTPPSPPLHLVTAVTIRVKS